MNASHTYSHFLIAPVMTKLLVVMLLLPVYYPMFAGVNAPIPLVGYIIGTLHSILV